MHGQTIGAKTKKHTFIQPIANQSNLFHNSMYVRMYVLLPPRPTYITIPSKWYKLSTETKTNITTKSAERHPRKK